MAVASNTNTGSALGWDERIDNPNEGTGFVLLPEGVYSFTVAKFERGRFDGSEKMCACPKAILTLHIETEDGAVPLKKDLFLNKKCEGILCAFFTCIGLRKHGEPLVMAWNRVVGCTGRIKLGIKKGDNKDFNEVKAWLEPEEVDPNKATIPF